MSQGNEKKRAGMDLDAQSRQSAAYATDEEEQHDPAVARRASLVGLRQEAGKADASSAAQQTFDGLAPRFDHGFDGVQVHAGAEGDARAQAHGSLAVTEGSEIFLSSAVSPQSPEGQRVMAHEMAHVVQQSGASAGTGASGARGDAFEREADHVGAAVAAGGSATPALKTSETMVQGYGAAEHQSMGNDVHAELDQVLAESEDPLYGVCTPEHDDPIGGQSRIPTLGGVTGDELAQQGYNEALSGGASHSPGFASADAAPNKAVEVPHLAEMLARDPFQDRARSLTLPLRNFKMQTDAAGAYLAIETDPISKEAVRYDVPVSPGDMTALMGDLYGSMENLRKAPVNEFIEVQRVTDAEARWEQGVAAGTANPKNAPDFGGQWEAATAWRGQPVYGAGRELGPEGAATEGDTKSYIGLAMDNRAHFGEGTAQKQELELKVSSEGVPALARGPQGNYANGNEQAWINGHAKALVLAQEAYTLRSATSGAPMTPAQINATADPYGHEANVPETGLVKPGAGEVPKLSTDADGHALKRSSGAATYASKLNDAYVENAGADHYLTDSYAAGHQIVRDVIGEVTDQFVKDKGGRDAFLEFVVEKIQLGAIGDSEKAEGDLGDFQEASRTWKDKAARGDSWLNSKWNLLRHVGIGGDGLKQKLEQQIDETKLHGIGAKLVHDYYNKRGVLVQNRKGMSFVTKGDGYADQSPEARRIIALSILESRTQITDLANNGVMPNPMHVWEYTPDFDKTVFTETSGKKVMQEMFSDSTYLWNLIKNNFSVGQGGGGSGAARAQSASNTTEDEIRGPDMAGAGAGSHAPADVGTGPIRDWLRRRRDYIQQYADNPPGGRPAHGMPKSTADDVEIP